MKQLLIAAIFSSIFFACTSNAQNITLVDGGKSDYHIVIPSKATQQEKTAATELKYYLYLISGVQIGIVADNEPPKVTEIVVGKTNRGLDKVDYNRLGGDGVVIKTVGKKLMITGGSRKGVLYGVYTFLDEYLGCKKYSKDATFIPEQKKIVLGSINKVELPTFAFRSTFFIDALDTAYADWHRLNYFFEGYGSFAHTFNTLLPPEKYFTQHPEYFAFVNGKRHPVQLCLSNPDVLKIAIQNLRKQMNERPELQIWSVSPNDNLNVCSCNLCSPAHAERGYMGTLLRFVNRIARAFPNKTISTLAYNHSLRPPLGEKPERNVLIMFCMSGVNRGKPIAVDNGENTVRFRDALDEWLRLTNNILVWDYIVQFSYSLSPYPNLHTLKPNLLYFRNKGIKMLFEQGIGAQKGEFSELKTYLIAKLQWNPDADEKKITQEFLNGYYGKAGAELIKYINLLDREYKRSNLTLDMYNNNNPVTAAQSFLSVNNIASYRKIFMTAENLVKSNPVVHKRLIKERLAVDYAELEILKRELRSSVRTNAKKAPTNTLLTAKDPRGGIKDKLSQFVTDCKTAGVTLLRESSIRPEEYANEFLREED